MRKFLQTWKQSDLCSLLGIETPVIQAPMAGGATTVELVAAVCNEGALGSIGAGYMDAEALDKMIDELRTKTSKPFAVNVFIPGPYSSSLIEQEEAARQINVVCKELDIDVKPVSPPYIASFEEQMEVIVEKKVPICSFTFGVLENKWVERLKATGTRIIGSATSLDEALSLQESGVDIISAQSMEAGGHRATFMGKSQNNLIGGFSLIPQIVDHTSLPVVAAGGIMDARGIVAALALGAQGVQMGTAFLTCPESGIHIAYKKRLLEQKKDQTCLTEAFSGKLARGISNLFTERMATDNKKYLDYPIQNALTAAMRKKAAKMNNPEFLSLWAGQSAYLSKGLPAAQFIKELKHVLENLLGEDL